MSRKKSDRKKSGRAGRGVRDVAQQAINHLQNLLDADQHNGIATTICEATDIANAVTVFARGLTLEARQQGLAASNALSVNLLELAKKNPAAAFPAFYGITLALALGSALGSDAPEPEPAMSAQDVTELQTTTKGWIARSIDPNVSPEERERAKKLIADFGIG